MLGCRDTGAVISTPLPAKFLMIPCTVPQEQTPLRRLPKTEFMLLPESKRKPAWAPHQYRFFSGRLQPTPLSNRTIYPLTVYQCPSAAWGSRPCHTSARSVSRSGVRGCTLRSTPAL